MVLASQRAADLTRQMLAYAGKGRFIVRPVNLSEIARDIASLVRSSVPKSVVLEVNLADHLPAVETDAGQMQQVIMNLVINGAEAVGEGRRGRVRMTTKVEHLSKKYLQTYFAGRELQPGPICEP